MPLLYTKKEVFQWLKDGTKTIDVRKGLPRDGEFAVFQCGPETLKMRIVAHKSGRLSDIIHDDNFLRVIPSATSVGDAWAFLRGLYPGYDEVFTAYYLEACKC
jgi:ASC-1-like (ASCH) protein